MRRFGSSIVLAGSILLLAMLLICPACADQTIIINDYGTTPFVYGGYSYIPLRSASDFLGAALLWDSVKDRATISYGGNEVGLTVGSPIAYYGGKEHPMPVAPVVIDGRTFIPTAVVRDIFGVPVVWDGPASQVRIKGPNGWGRLIVSRHPSKHIVKIMKRHGNPPWSGGPGQRAVPPPGLATKPGGLPPGQAKKLGNQSTVIVIDSDKDDKGKNGNNGKGNAQGKDKDAE